MSLPIIQSLWIGSELTLNKQLCISSFRYHGHSFHPYTHNDIKNIPDRVVVKNAIRDPESLIECFRSKYLGSL